MGNLGGQVVKIQDFKNNIFVEMTVGDFQVWWKY